MVELEGAGLQLQSTPRLREFLRKVASTPTVSNGTREASSRWAAEDSAAVPFSFLRDVYSELRADEQIPVHLLLAGSSFALESPKPREKSEELKARLKKLQEMADKQEYEKLVHDITKHSKEPEYFSSYKDQLGFGIHVAVTMFTGFAFGYTIFRSQFRDTPVLHAAGGAVGLILGMLLETVLFIVRDVQREKMEDISKREKERRSRASSRNQT